MPRIVFSFVVEGERGRYVTVSERRVGEEGRELYVIVTLRAFLHIGRVECVTCQG